MRCALYPVAKALYNKCCIYYALLNHEFELILFYTICINDIIYVSFFVLVQLPLYTITANWFLYDVPEVVNW